MQQPQPDIPVRLQPLPGQVLVPGGGQQVQAGQGQVGAHGHGHGHSYGHGHGHGHGYCYLSIQNILQMGRPALPYRQFA